MKSTLSVLLIVLGGSAVLIALSILVMGAGPTAAFGERMFSLSTGWQGPATPEWPASMDNELRFYAALWLAYGVLALRAGRNLQQRLGDVPPLAGVFFLGGVGRALSWALVGAPHPFFLTLMATELTLPPLMLLLCSQLRRTGHTRAR